MFEEYKYKTELHAHTTPASTCSEITPEHMIEVYSGLGYTSIAITNHFVYVKGGRTMADIDNYLDDFHKCRELGEKTGINVIFGAEIRFSENLNDYLVYGIDENDMKYIDEQLGDGIDNFYKNYRNEKNIILQAHPFRDMCERCNPESIDGIEAFNVHPYHNSKIGFATKYAAENDFIVTCGTDFHHKGHEGLCGILTKKPIKNSFELAEVLKKRDYILELSGYRILV